MKPPKNIIFIGVDTLRYDCISCERDRHSLERYGAADRVDTPTIDRIAAQGVRFSQSITVTPYTSASFASIFTGLYPPRHNVRATYYTKMAPTVTTLAERLQGAGYDTFQILDLDNQLNPTGVTRGIDHRFLTTTGRNDTDALCRALARDRDRKKFLFAYFLDVSNPYGFSHVEPWHGYNDEYYRCVEELKERFLKGEEASRDRVDKYYTWGKVKHTMFSGEHKDEVVKLYIDGVNKFSEGRFAWFMGRLEEIGFLEDALVVITADHGEADYGFDFTHGGDLTEDVLRVPLVMSCPGVLPEGRVVNEQVSQVDITPTVLELAGIRCDEALDGRSLVPAIKGQERPVRVAYSEVWGYQWEKVRVFMLAEGLLTDRKPEYDVFLRQRTVRTPRFKYVLYGESHEETVDDFNKELLVKWACRNHYFRHENDEEMKCWWEKLYSGEIDERGLIEGILATPDAKARHGLFDLEEDPFEEKNLLLDEKNNALLCEAMDLQDELLQISRTEFPIQNFQRTIYSEMERNGREKERIAEGPARIGEGVVRDGDDGAPELDSAVWFLTWKCNNRCPYCWEVQRQARGEFRPEAFKDARVWVDAWNRLNPGILDITGGEPWLQPGFIDLLEGLDDRIQIAITTNATKDLTEFVQRMRPEKICSMTLSLHPSQRMSRETFVGKCHLLKNRGFSITVNFVAWPEQMWLIPMYKELFEKQGIRFHVDPYVPTPDGLYEFSEPEKDFLRQYVPEDRSYWFGEVDKVPVLCSGGCDYLNVQPNGEAFRCIRDRITDGDRVGNILDRDFSLNEEWTYCEDYHRCPGCDRDKVKVRRIEEAKGVKRSEPLLYTL